MSVQKAHCFSFDADHRRTELGNLSRVAESGDLGGDWVVSVTVYPDNRWIRAPNGGDSGHMQRH